MDQVSSASKLVVITGATSGIGRACAIRLAGCGARLVLVGRNEKKGKEVINAIRSSSSQCISEFLQADLSNLAEVRALALRIKDRYDRVDVLINNAGARFSHFEQTPDGYERTFATNHLGHFLLTALILDRMLGSAAARIITVGSGAHFGVHGCPIWILTRETYERKLAYATSKLAGTMFAYELARRLSGTTITSNAVDPGGVATNLGRNNGLAAWLRHLAYYALKGRLLTPSRAASHIVFMALAEEFEGITGQYFFESKPVTSSGLSQDIDTAQNLWSLSVSLTGIDASLGKAWKYVQPRDCP